MPPFYKQTFIKKKELYVQKMGLDGMASARRHRMRGTKELYAQKMGLDGMASARGHRMQGTEHVIAFFLALGCAIALHCIALYCSVLYLLRDVVPLDQVILLSFAPCRHGYMT